jgi:REP element-mobilizing transposase RayT
MEYWHKHYGVHLVVHYIIQRDKRWRRVLVGPVHDPLEQLIREVAAEFAWTMIELTMQAARMHLHRDPCIASRVFQHLATFRAYTAEPERVGVTMDRAAPAHTSQICVVC